MAQTQAIASRLLKSICDFSLRASYLGSTFLCFFLSPFSDTIGFKNLRENL